MAVLDRCLQAGAVRAPTQIDIATGTVLHGSLPRRAANLVAEWAELHRAELEPNWERAVAELPLVSIEPLPRAPPTTSAPSSTSAGTG